MTKDAKKLGEEICRRFATMDIDEIIDLMERGADVNIDANAYPILIEAVRDHNPAVVEVLTRYPQVHINAQDSHGMTALIHAIFDGHNDIVDVLLSRDRLNLNLKTALDQTAVVIAVTMRNFDVAKKLMEDPRTKIKTRDSKGMLLRDYIEKHDRKMDVTPLMPVYNKALDIRRQAIIDNIDRTKEEIPVKRLKLNKRPKR